MFLNLPKSLSKNILSPYSNLTSQIFNNKSVILMIGDGFGFEQMELAQLIELGKEGSLTVENLLYHLDVTTSSASNVITDSAAAATAMATGYKTNNGMISISPLNSILETILEMSRTNNKSTGIATTTEITHATPAAFMSHVSSRSNYAEIARQIVEESDVDVVLGGGLVRFDQTDLDTLEAKGYDLVYNRTSLMSSYSERIFGLFSDAHLPYEFERDIETTPSLTEMTLKALDLLDTNDKGFFLMVEGGRIDHACHDNNKINTALEAIEFLNAVSQVISYLDSRQDVLLIVTADHETGGLKIINDSLNNTLPSTSNTFLENKLIRLERLNNVTTSWSTTGHTSKNVPFFSNSLNLNNFENMSTIENTDIFNIINQYLEIPEIPEEEDENNDDTSFEPIFDFKSLGNLLFFFILISIITVCFKYRYHI